MSIQIEFGDGTDVDTWRTVFTGLVNRVMEADFTVHDQRGSTQLTRDVVLRSIDEHPTEFRSGFWFSHWNEDTDEPVEEQFFVELDDLHSILIY